MYVATFETQNRSQPLGNQLVSSFQAGEVAPWTVVGRLSLAAMLILCVGLHLSAERVARQTSAWLHPAPTKWTAQAEEAIELLNGQGRRYIALALAADEPRIARLLREKAPVSLFKDIP